MSLWICKFKNKKGVLIEAVFTIYGPICYWLVIPLLYYIFMLYNSFLLFLWLNYKNLNIVTVVAQWTTFDYKCDGSIVIQKNVLNQRNDYYFHFSTLLDKARRLVPPMSEQFGRKVYIQIHSYIPSAYHTTYSTVNNTSSWS